MFIQNYFETAKRNLGFTSDAELGRHLGLTPQEMINAKRKGHIRKEALEILSIAASAPMPELVAAREADKKHADGSGEIWVQVYEAVKRAGAVAGIGAVLLSGLPSTGVKVNDVQPRNTPAVFITGNRIRTGKNRGIQESTRGSAVIHLISTTFSGLFARFFPRLGFTALT